MRFQKNLTYYTNIDLLKFLFLCVCILVIFVLFAGNTYNPDYFANSTIYSSRDFSFDGFLNSFIAHIFSSLGLSYQFFVMGKALLSCYLLHNIVKKYCGSNPMVLVLYIIYPFFLDIVQIDNFIAYLIVINSLHFLKKFSKQNLINYIISLALASGFHIASVAYLLFILVYLKKKRNLLIFVGMIIVFVTINIASIPLYFNKIPYLNKYSDQLSYYLTYTSSVQGGAIRYAILSSTFFLLCLLKKSLSLRQGIDISHSDYLLKILFVSLSFIPLIIINSEFVRLIRNLWIVYYCYLLDTRKIKGRMLFYISVIMLSLFLFYKELSPNAYYFNTVTQNILKKNLFF